MVYVVPQVTDPDMRGNLLLIRQILDYFQRRQRRSHGRKHTSSLDFFFFFAASDAVNTLVLSRTSVRSALFPQENNFHHNHLQLSGNEIYVVLFRNNNSFSIGMEHQIAYFCCFFSFSYHYKISCALGPQISFNEVGFWKTMGMKILTWSVPITKWDVLHLFTAFQCYETS